MSKQKRGAASATARGKAQTATRRAVQPKPRVGRQSKSKRAAVRQLGEQLTTLESSGLIHLAQAQPELEYLFRHALLQEATYHTLVKQDRKRLHRAVGETLEQAYPDRVDELAPLLAQHFYEAEERARALRYFTLAGDLAARKYANAEAIIHYSRALALATSEALPDAGLLHLYTARGRALEMSGQYDEALANYAEMEQQAHTRADRALELAALIARATVHSAPTTRFDAVEAQALSDRSLALAHVLHDRAVEAKILWNLALVHKFRSRWQEVVEYGEQSAAIARELNLREQLAYTLNDTFTGYMSIGQMQRARDLLDEARQLWRELGNMPMLADSLANAAEMEYTAGDIDRALAYAEEAYRIGCSIGNLWNQSYSLGTMGQALVERGDIDEGIAALEQAVALGQRAGFGIAQLYGYGILGLTYGTLGDSERGIAAARRALAAAEELFPGWKAMPMALVAMLLVWNRQIDEAAMLIQQAYASVNADDMQSFILLALADGELGLARGEYERVLTITENFSTMLSAVGIRAYLGRILYPKGEALMGLGRWAEAKAAFAAARAEEEVRGSRLLLWRMLLRLSEMAEREGDADGAQRLRHQAREVIEYIAAHIAAPELRAAFLNQPEASAILNVP